MLEADEAADDASEEAPEARDDAEERVALAEEEAPEAAEEAEEEVPLAGAVQRFLKVSSALIFEDVGGRAHQQWSIQRP